ncbi:MAG: LysM peptidoglycan-binding domain-containing protein [Candidatus Krumholzibacteriia bacterium]
MTHPRQSSPFYRNFHPAHNPFAPRVARLGRLGGAWLTVAALALTGCAASGPGRETAREPAPGGVDSLFALDGAPAAAADSVATTLPDEQVVILPVGPDGRASLADLETLYRQALDHVAQADDQLAEDLLMVLQDQVLMPVPAAADSTWQAHLSSFERRLYLLGGLIAESRAFAGAPAGADSLLAAGYQALDRFAMPDSLVPATGTELPPLVADLLEVDNKAVRKWLDYFTGNGRRHLSVWLERKSAVEPLITRILDEHGLPRELVYLAMIESGLSPRAHSSAGAVGPWQFMPGTGRRYGLRQNWWVDERRDFELSTQAAARYLSALYEEFGNWALVLAAYNSGENRVARQIRLTGHDDYWRLRLPLQTTDYVPKFIAAARIGEDPDDYGFTVGESAPVAFESVSVADATDLSLIAECAGVEAAEVALLNPALLRGASPPDLGEYAVRVPVGTGDRTAAELKKIPADRRLTWRSHRVQRGETLSQIASRYGTSTADISRLNNVRNPHLIRPGDQLLIPMPAELAAKATRRAGEKGHYVPPDGYERVSYSVRKGDTLGAIARSLGVSVVHLRKVNALQRTHLIYPGQRIYAYRPAS